MKEANFQSDMIDEILDAFPEAIVIKNDASYLLGIPDITILYRSRWAFIECKKETRSRRQPLQDDYVGYAQTWSFGAFACKENWKTVREELFRYLADDE